MLLVLDCILRLGVQEQVQLGGIRNPETTSVTGCTNGTRAPVPPHTKATVRDMPPSTEFQGDGPEAFPERGVPLHPHPLPSPHRKQAWAKRSKAVPLRVFIIPKDWEVSSVNCMGADI